MATAGIEAESAFDYLYFYFHESSDSDGVGEEVSRMLKTFRQLRDRFPALSDPMQARLTDLALVSLIYKVQGRGVNTDPSILDVLSGHYGVDRRDLHNVELAVFTALDHTIPLGLSSSSS